MNLWDTIMDMLQPQAGGDFKPLHQAQIPKIFDPCVTACIRHCTSSNITAIGRHTHQRTMRR